MNIEKVINKSYPDKPCYKVSYDDATFWSDSYEKCEFWYYDRELNKAQYDMIKELEDVGMASWAK